MFGMEVLLALSERLLTGKSNINSEVTQVAVSIARDHIFAIDFPYRVAFSVSLVEQVFK